MAAPVWVGISDLVIAPEYQMREKLSAETVAEYAELLKGSSWPFSSPCSVVRVDGRLILVDGFHRVAAVQKAGEDQVSVVIVDGTRTDALKAALSANITHGLRRTNADKRRAVEMALKDKTLEKWSDHKLADLCGVSQPFVGQIRGELKTVISSPGKPHTQNGVRVGADGKSRPADKQSQITQQQKVTAAIVANPDDSDRQIAEMVGCDHKTVGKVRREMNGNEEPEPSHEDDTPEPSSEFEYAKAIERLNRAVRSELDKWPDEHRAEAVAWVKTIIEEYDV